MWPQAPQLLRSLRILTQTPLHSLLSLGQRQPPLRQTWPSTQAWLQPPQWLVLVWVSTHCPLQTTLSGLGQTHRSWTQVVAAGQTWPHLPQLFGSLRILTQTPLHSFWSL